MVIGQWDCSKTSVNVPSSQVTLGCVSWQWKLIRILFLPIVSVMLLRGVAFGWRCHHGPSTFTKENRALILQQGTNWLPAPSTMQEFHHKIPFLQSKRDTVTVGTLILSFPLSQNYEQYISFVY